MKNIKTVLLSIAIVLVHSCIKENRDLCPFTMEVDLSAIETSNHENIRIVIADNPTGNIVIDRYIEGDSLKCSHKFKLPKGEYSFNVWGNINNGSYYDSQKKEVSLVYGRYPDAVLFYCNTIKCFSEYWIETPILQRYTSSIHVEIIDDNNSLRGQEVKIVSSSAGYTFDGVPINGEHAFISNNSESDTFNLIRQFCRKDVYISISDIYGESFRIPMGEILFEMGIDLESPVMCDVSLVLDIAHLSMSVFVEDWIQMGDITCIFNTKY